MTFSKGTITRNVKGAVFVADILVFVYVIIAWGEIRECIQNGDA